ncbi:MAG: UvrD-helicase domain-containing protein, partial [Thomasclavelia spiroformis]
MDLDKLLNKNQKESATYLDSHLRIIAVAGSGKTRVIK